MNLNKSSVLFLILGILIGFICSYITIGYPKNNNIPSQINNSLSSTEKEFNKNFYYYTATLPQDQRKYISDRIEKIQGDETFANTFVAMAITELTKDKEAKSIIDTLKKDIMPSIQNNQANREKLFAKNTECASLVDGIKKQIEVRNKKSLGKYLFGSEEFKYIFYSPKQSSCIYVALYEESSSALLDNYYTLKQTRIYNPTSDTAVQKFTINCYKCPEYKESEAYDKASEAKQDYYKYILENSNYDVSLLDPSKDIY